MEQKEREKRKKRLKDDLEKGRRTKEQFPDSFREAGEQNDRYKISINM